MDPSAPPSTPAPPTEADTASPSVVGIHPVAAVESVRRLRRRWAGIVVGVLTSLVILLAAHRYWQLQQTEAGRRQLEERVAIARELERAGNLDAALASFHHIINECEDDPAFEPVRARLGKEVSILEASRAFLKHASEIRAAGALEARAGTGGHIEQRCEDVLEVHRDLKERLDETTFRPAQFDEIRARAADVRVVLAMRLLLRDPRDPDGRMAIRRALELLQRADEILGPSYRVWLLRSECQRRLGDLVAADHTLEQAEKLRPQTAEDFTLRGYLALRLAHNPAAAIEQFRHALQHDPGCYPAHTGLLRTFQDTNDWSNQVATATACLALRPGELDLFYLRGLAHFNLNEYPAALADLDACLQREPKHRDSLFWRGRLHLLAGRWQLAERDFTAALILDKDPSPYRWRAYARAMLNQHRDAVADVEQSLKLQPGPATSWHAARTYARCVRGIESDPKEKQNAERYGKRAVELLRSAVRAGYGKRAGERELLRASADLDALRARRDFEELLRDVETRDQR
jgi:tetratricopeptide (TPR) repeat protein